MCRAGRYRTTEGDHLRIRNPDTMAMAPVSVLHEEQEVPNPVRISDFMAHVHNQHRDTNMGFAQEYETLRVRWSLSGNRK